MATVRALPALLLSQQKKKTPHRRWGYSDDMHPPRPSAFSLESTRVSYPIITLCTGVGLAFGMYAVLNPYDFLGWIGLIISLSILLNFHTIRILVDRETLLVSYGIGFIAREFDLHGITNIEMIDNYTLHAVYNSSAERVPRIHTRDGRSIVLPMSDTRRLMEVLRLPHA